MKKYTKIENTISNGVKISHKREWNEEMHFKTLNSINKVWDNMPKGQIREKETALNKNGIGYIKYTMKNKKEIREIILIIEDI